MDLIAHPPSPVDIIEVCRVTPSPCSSPEQQSLTPHSLPLTFFDLLWLRFHPIQRLFFYQDTAISSLDAILPKLKTSLSLALRHYLPLAGNLLWPPHSVVPTVEFVEGDGVLLTVAESDAHFRHLSGYGFRGVTEYHPLVPQLPVSHDRAAVIALQVTLFPNSGFSIGMTNHHAVLDGRTATSFVKLWARICKLHVAGGLYDLTTEPMPFYNRIEDPRGIAEIYANVWLKDKGPNNRSLNLHLPNTPQGLIRCSLHLTRQHLQNLKQSVLNNKNNQHSKNSDHHSHISSFALATAYICVCTAKSEALTEGKLVFAFVADARFRLKPPMPSNYFGNCLSGRAIFIERSELLGENGMVVASEAISEGIKGLEEGALNGVENWCSMMATATVDGDDFGGNYKPISVAGSPRFEVYSADFGWGRPIKVELVSAESSETIALSESRDGDGGMEIGVVKNKDEIENFVALFSKGLECL